MKLQGFSVFGFFQYSQSFRKNMYGILNKHYIDSTYSLYLTLGWRLVTRSLGRDAILVHLSKRMLTQRENVNVIEIYRHGGDFTVNWKSRR